MSHDCMSNVDKAGQAGCLGPRPPAWAKSHIAEVSRGIWFPSNRAWSTYGLRQAGQAGPHLILWRMIADNEVMVLPGSDTAHPAI